MNPSKGTHGGRRPNQTGRRRVPDKALPISIRVAPALFAAYQDAPKPLRAAARAAMVDALRVALADTRADTP